MAMTRTEIQNRYDSKNCTRYSIKLNNKTDAVIIEKLSAVKSVQGYIRQCILDDIQRNGSAPKSGKETEDNTMNKLWYAVQRDRDDDWGTGSFDREQAVKMARKQREDYPDTLIAVIENSTCIEEITEF